MIGSLIILLFLTQLTLISQTPFNKGVNLTSWFQTGSAQEIQLNRYTKEDFEDIKSLGCDVVRLPVNLIAMTNGSPNYLIDPLYFTFMDTVLHWAETTNMHLILDNHTFDPAQNTTPDIEKFLEKVWPQLAYRYKGSYDKLYFEILNEPHGITDLSWNNIQQRVIEKIRLVDQERILIVGPAGWNSYHNLDAMPLYQDTKLIYTFHFYDPFLFTHQGASWTDPSMESLERIPFPYSQNLMPGLPSELVGTWIESSYNNYSQEGTVAHMQSLLDIAIQFKNERNVPIFCGEFGVLHNNVENEYHRNKWYLEVRQYLEQNGISWTIWDYHGGFGLFEKNSSGFFDHDLNIPLLQALGLNTPDQSEFEIKPDSSNIVLYDDFIGKNIYASNYSNGPISMYENDTPKQGDFYISWKNPDQYNQVGFDFQPNRNLKYLVEEDYRFECWIKGNKPGTKLDIRFIDSKIDDGVDRPWRMRYILDESTVIWNGQWQKISILLSAFTEHGSWDENNWYEPIGAFDWTDIDRFEIVNEYGTQNPIEFGFDLIQITSPPVKTLNTESANFSNVYPVPATNQLNVTNSDNIASYSITDLNGLLVQSGQIDFDQKINIESLIQGYYIIIFYNINNSMSSIRFCKL